MNFCCYEKIPEAINFTKTKRFFSLRSLVQRSKGAWHLSSGEGPFAAGASQGQAFTFEIGSQ